MGIDMRVGCECIVSHGRSLPRRHGIVFHPFVESKQNISQSAVTQRQRQSQEYYIPFELDRLENRQCNDFGCSALKTRENQTDETFIWVVISTNPSTPSQQPSESKRVMTADSRQLSETFDICNCGSNTRIPLGLIYS